MTVNYFVVQQNAKGEKKNKLLFSEEMDLIFAGTEIGHKQKRFQIQYMQVLPTSISAICFELNTKDDTKNKTNTPPRSTEDNEFPECPKC
jgi:hypothetical protein